MLREMIQNNDLCVLQGKRPHEVTLAEVKRPQEVKFINIDQFLVN